MFFCLGGKKGIFPNQRSLDENGNKGLEEERRLAYVGITRARKKLSISFVTLENNIIIIFIDLFLQDFCQNYQKNCELRLNQSLKEKKQRKLTTLKVMNS